MKTLKIIGVAIFGFLAAIMLFNFFEDFIFDVALLAFAFFAFAMACFSSLKNQRSDNEIKQERAKNKRNEMLPIGLVALGMIIGIVVFVSNNPGDEGFAQVVTPPPSSQTHEPTQPATETPTEIDELTYITSWDFFDEDDINHELTTFSDFDDRDIHYFEFATSLEAGTYRMVMHSTGVVGSTAIHVSRGNFGFLSERETLMNYGDIIGMASFGASNSTALGNEATLIVDEDSEITFSTSDLENLDGIYFTGFSIYRVD